MSDIAKPIAGQTENGAPATPPAAPAAPAAPATSDAELKLLKTQLAAAQREAAQLKKAEEDRQNAQLSEVDQLKASNGQLSGKVTSLESALSNQAKTFAFKLAASQAGCANADAAAKLADLSTLTVSDTGEIVGVNELLGVFKEQHSYFFASGTTPTAPKPPVVTSGGNTGSGAPAPSADIEKLRDMSPAERLNYFTQREKRARI